MLLGSLFQKLAKILDRFRDVDDDRHPVHLGIERYFPARVYPLGLKRQEIFTRIRVSNSYTYRTFLPYAPFCTRRSRRSRTAESVP